MRTEGKIITRKTKHSENKCNSDICNANELNVFNILNFKTFPTCTYSQLSLTLQRENLRY